MRILLLGAYGFIGSAIARSLTGRGHHVVGVGRDLSYGRRILPAVQWVKLDLNQMSDASSWAPLVADVDCVINASGLLQSGDGGSLVLVQHDAIVALIEACRNSDVMRLVQISAAGADAGSPNLFLATKGRADDALAHSKLNFLILRPGLVIDRNCYGGTRLIRMAAAMPFDLDFGFDKPIQCAAMDDLVEAVLIGVALPNGTSITVDLVEGEARTLPEIIAMHRRWLGLGKAKVRMSIPVLVVTGAASMADALGKLGWRSPLRSNALLALRQGIVGDAKASERFLSRCPQSLEETLAANPAGIQDRVFARLNLMLPIMLVSLVIMWAASGLGTLVRLDDAIGILVQGGVEPPLARLIAIVGAAADLVLAAGLLWRRTVRTSLLLMLFLTVFVYLAGGTILLPHLWTDPLAPFAKALPAAMLALVAWAMLEKR